MGEKHGLLGKAGDLEGPFDLLLSLIDKAEIDIMDIPIARITEDYLDYIRKMQELDLVVSGNSWSWLRLCCRLKPKCCCPRNLPCPDAVGEEEADPREELVRRLLEYKFYKQVAQILKEQADEVAVFPRAYFEAVGEQTPVYLNRVGDADAKTLAGLFAQVLAALEESKKVTYIKRDMSLAEAVANLRLTLVKQRTVRFSELLVNNDRVFIVYTFLAVLELIRLREIYAVQERLFGDIQLVRR